MPGPSLNSSIYDGFLGRRERRAGQKSSARASPGRADDELNAMTIAGQFKPKDRVVIDLPVPAAGRWP